jgi:gluconolactonase
LVDWPLGPLEGAAVEIADESFGGAVDADAVVERLWTGGVWTEGPAWLPGAQMLVWSDIPNNRMLAWHQADGRVETFRQPSSGGNGNTADREGRLVTCEQYARRITRTEADGTVTVLAGRFGGRRFTAPNDVVVKSDGSVWFTDPDYGRSTNYEGERELEGCHVYRIDPETGRVRQMTNDMVMPNGLAFSPDERWLYVIDTGSTHRPDGPNHIRVFPVGADQSLGEGRVIATDEAKRFDGLRVDVEGRLWCGVAEGVRCLLPDGRVIGRIRLPERASNLCFGGPELTRLFITGTSSLYAVPLKTTSAVGA